MARPSKPRKQLKTVIFKWDPVLKDNAEEMSEDNNQSLTAYVKTLVERDIKKAKRAGKIFRENVEK